MAKLTVHFNDKVIRSYQYETGSIRIGRDSSNDITLNSTSVAENHALIVLHHDTAIIKQLHDDAPLMINGNAAHEHALIDNDQIQLGNYRLVYQTTQPSHIARAVENNTRIHTKNFESEDMLPGAGLQIIKGANIGKILPIKRTLTRFGTLGRGVAVITKRKEGYFISALESAEKLRVNNKPLGDHCYRLNHNDVVIVENMTMQFFLY